LRKAPAGHVCTSLVWSRGAGRPALQGTNGHCPALKGLQQDKGALRARRFCRYLHSYSPPILRSVIGPITVSQSQRRWIRGDLPAVEVPLRFQSEPRWNQKSPETLSQIRRPEAFFSSSNPQERAFIRTLTSHLFGAPGQQTVDGGVKPLRPRATGAE